MFLLNLIFGTLQILLWYKLNTDVAVEKERGFSSLGCIIRNSEGVVMAATISKKPCLGDPKIAEALSILKGISSRGELDWIICEIRALLDQKNQYKVVYTPRSCNFVAHGLVKMALSS
ncbi:hypothetical protein WN943_027850 [Citrus x changshan-huyou]